MTLDDFKKLFRRYIKVVAGGPEDKTRGKGMLTILDALAKSLTELLLSKSVTLAEAQDLLTTPVPALEDGARYAVTGPWDGLATDSKVYVLALTTSTFEPTGILVRDGERSLVKVDVAAGTTMPVNTASSFAELEGEPADNAALAAALAGKADLVGGVIPATQLPSYVDDVIEANSFTALPANGERGKIYVATDSNKQYRWGLTQYIEIGKSIALYTGTGSAVDGAMNQQAATAEYLKYLPLSGSTDALPMRGRIKWGTGSVFGFDSYLFLQNGRRTLQLYNNGLTFFNDDAGGSGANIDADENGDLLLNTLRVVGFFDCRSRDITARRIPSGTLVYTNAGAVYLCYTAAPVGTAEPTDNTANYIKLFGTSTGGGAGGGAASFATLSGVPEDNAELVKSFKKLASILPATTSRGDYTLQLSDAGCQIPVATANGLATVTVPADEDINFPVGTILEVSQENNATVTIAGGVGSSSGTKVVLEAYLDAYTTAGQFAVVGLRKMGANRWRVTGGAQ
jgi:hypothetical protein